MHVKLIIWSVNRFQNTISVALKDGELPTIELGPPKDNIWMSEIRDIVSNITLWDKQWIVPKPIEPVFLNDKWYMIFEMVVPPNSKLHNGYEFVVHDMNTDNTISQLLRKIKV